MDIDPREVQIESFESIPVIGGVVQYCSWYKIELGKITIAYPNTSADGPEEIIKEFDPKDVLISGWVPGSY